MKPSSKKLLTATTAVGLLLLLIRRAKAAGARGDVHIGPVTVTPTAPVTEAERLAHVRLKLAVDRARAAAAFDPDVGSQRALTEPQRAELGQTIALWKKVAGTSPDLLERIARETRSRPKTDLLVNATRRIRSLVGWNPEWGSVNRKPTAAEAKEIRAGIELWQAYSGPAADYLQLLLDDALALPTA